MQQLAVCYIGGTATHEQMMVKVRYDLMLKSTLIGFFIDHQTRQSSQNTYRLDNNLSSPHIGKFGACEVMPAAYHGHLHANARISCGMMTRAMSAHGDGITNWSCETSWILLTVRASLLQLVCSMLIYSSWLLVAVQINIFCIRYPRFLSVCLLDLPRACP